MKSSFLSAGLLASLLIALPTLARDKATLSFGAVVIPSQEVVSCIHQEKTATNRSSEKYNPRCKSILSDFNSR